MSRSPKRIVDLYNIRPGDDIVWVPAGQMIRVIPSRKPAVTEDSASRLRLFDQRDESESERKK